MIGVGIAAAAAEVGHGGTIFVNQAETDVPLLRPRNQPIKSLIIKA
jgi:hypothetical protein